MFCQFQLVDSPQPAGWAGSTTTHCHANWEVGAENMQAGWWGHVLEQIGWIPCIVVDEVFGLGGKKRLYANCHSGLRLTDWSREKLELRSMPMFSLSLTRLCPAFLPKASESWYTREDGGAGSSALPTSRTTSAFWRVPHRKNKNNKKKQIHQHKYF